MRFIFYFIVFITSSKSAKYKEPFYCNELPDKYVKKGPTPWLVLLLVIGCPKENDQNERSRSAASFPDDCNNFKNVAFSDYVTVLEGTP